ncbi:MULTISPECIES: ABC transporter permease [Paenibacillus]|uniref:Ribose ABC transporter permease n=1 Tax=Paenibacillus naphthalenovorans TaxID=162209 RepID=A0A0U2UJM8_9BACL|nr:MULTISPECIES: ABC transporter permease [Paenibacillus]ALS23356.1 ribose ABC transporter permease [Paenibacillus naphthalenovorans]GCL72836.1 ABC transporter permease [Paenibacillus naphthalenovorans]SDI07806.1 ribose transport system permease protein/ribose transport system ATP-binding protein [Paenibacillus naphthalenovorans]
MNEENLAANQSSTDKIGIAGKKALYANQQNQMLAWLSKNKVLIALLLLCVFFSISTEQFLRMDNIQNIFLQSAIMGIVAIGMTYVIITAGIDLGVGSIVAVTGMVIAGMINSGVPIIAAILAGLLIGMISGIINGFFITRFHMAPFIVTLGMMAAARSVTLVYSDAQTISVYKDPFLQYLRMGKIAGIPVMILITAVLFLIAGYVLSNTVFGRHVYAIGSNKKAAEVSGIPVKRIEMMVYVIAGTLAAVGGLMMTARLGSGTPLAGVNLELMAIAAVVIGGTSLSGGRGTIFGTLIGVLLINVLNTGMNLMNISSHYQGLIMGAVILLAALIDSVSNKKSK